MGTGQSQGTTLTLPVQFCYLLLYGLGVAAALVQRGHPTLVFGVLGALLPLALLARVPRRWFPGWVRQVLQVLIAGAGVAWWPCNPAARPWTLFWLSRPPCSGWRWRWAAWPASTG
jgi:hypothetical protein